VDVVVAVIREVLPDALLGVYLHGSAVSGTLRPTSDLDLLAVTSRRTTHAEQRRLVERLLPVSGSGDPSGQSRSVDVEAVARGDVRPWRYPARLDFQYGDWHRPAFARGDFAPWNPEDPDLVIVLEAALQADRPLFGPPPADLFGPIPWSDARRAMLESVPDLLSYLDGDERNVVLTFARIWASLATGRLMSKDGAADWAMPLLRGEHRAVLAHARSLYVRGIAAEAWGDLMPRVRPLVEHLIGRIREAAGTTLA
jgi:predicted nucleotidyltransferase